MEAQHDLQARRTEEAFTGGRQGACLRQMRSSLHGARQSSGDCSKARQEAIEMAKARESWA